MEDSSSEDKKEPTKISQIRITLNVGDKVSLNKVESIEPVEGELLDNTNNIIEPKTGVTDIAGMITGLGEDILKKFGDAYVNRLSTSDQDYRTENDFMHTISRMGGMDKPTAHDATIVLEEIRKQNNGAFPDNDYKTLYETLYNNLTSIDDADDKKWHTEIVEWKPVRVDNDSAGNLEVVEHGSSGGGKLRSKMVTGALKGIGEGIGKGAMGAVNALRSIRKGEQDENKSGNNENGSNSNDTTEVPRTPSTDEKTLLQLWNVARFHNPFYKQLGIAYTDVNKMTDGIKTSLENLLTNGEKIPNDFKILLEALKTAIKGQKDFYLLDQLKFSYCDEIVKMKGINNKLFNISENLPHIIFSGKSRTKAYKDGILPIWDSNLGYQGKWSKNTESEIVPIFLDELLIRKRGNIASNIVSKTGKGTRSLLFGKPKEGGKKRTRKNQPLK